VGAEGAEADAAKLEADTAAWVEAYEATVGRGDTA
jgi:hypothetical protein